MNSNATPTLEHHSGLPQTARRISRPVDRKPPKDPMKLFPYLFQFASPRLTEAEKSHVVQPDQRSARPSQLLAFRSPSDQLWVVAVPSRQVGDRPEFDVRDSLARAVTVRPAHEKS
jgi:hypothetical protein